MGRGEVSNPVEGQVKSNQILESQIIEELRQHHRDSEPLAIMEPGNTGPPDSGESVALDCDVFSWARCFHSSKTFRAARFRRKLRVVTVGCTRTHSQEAQSWDSAQVIVTPNLCCYYYFLPE